ncbi:MAG: 4Fe-4S binding protein [Anaerolineae bacterium]|nr:4Fe-4S binding protein [Anaerolineae bacterium]
MRHLFNLLLRIRRRPVQVLSFLVMNSYFTQNVTKGLPCLGFNCYACPAAAFACPIGSLQHFAVIREIPFYVLGVLGLFGALWGRAACGWLCPFGLLQELMYKVPLPKWHLSARLGWLRYAFLVALVFAIPYFTLEPWFCKLCPQGTLEAGIPQILLHPELRPLIGWLFALKIVILLAFLVWMAVTSRPFCRWVCPLGAIWSPFNPLSAVRIEVDSETCIACDRCQQVCPVNIRIHENADAAECVRCLECVRVCPVDCIHIFLRHD